MVDVVDVVKIGEIKVSVKKLCLKQCFLRTQIWIISLQGGLGPTVLEVVPISICSLKTMGEKLPNDLWACPVASKLSEQQPLTFFHCRDTENGQKRYFFAFLPITPMQKF